MKIRWTKRILGILLAAVTLFSVVTCFGCVQKEAPEPDQATPVQPKYVIRPAELGEAVEIHTEEQAGYLNDDYRNITDYIPPVANTERSQPQAVTLSWSVTGSETPSAVTYAVSIGISPSLSDAKTYTTTETGYPVTNLYIGTTYYWKVSFAEEGVTYESKIASFATTDQGPRNLTVEGVTNFRDIGGWTTMNGPKVKQGMIYRSARLDNITDAGKATMLEELGIKTEIDLRDGYTKSVLDGMNFLSCGCSDNATLVDLKKSLPKIFEALADERNYPIFYHCNIGTDRTGGLTFLINGLLGVSEADLYYDYCFSNFGKIANDDATGFTPRTPDELQGKIVLYLRNSSGKTMQEKIRNYLISIGISEATLNAVVRIMLE